MVSSFETRTWGKFVGCMAHPLDVTLYVHNWGIGILHQYLIHCHPFFLVLYLLVLFLALFLLLFLYHSSYFIHLLRGTNGIFTTTNDRDHARFFFQIQIWAQKTHMHMDWDKVLYDYTHKDKSLYPNQVLG
jgi:hypothetical protein